MTIASLECNYRATNPNKSIRDTKKMCSGKSKCFVFKFNPCRTSKRNRRETDDYSQRQQLLRVRLRMFGPMNVTDIH